MQFGLAEGLIAEGDHPHRLLTVVAVSEGRQHRLVVSALEQELLRCQWVGHQVAAAQIVVPIAQRIGDGLARLGGHLARREFRGQRLDGLAYHGRQRRLILRPVQRQVRTQDVCFGELAQGRHANVAQEMVWVEYAHVASWLDKG